MGVPHYVNLFDYVLNEILILGDLEHKNIAKMIEVIDDSGNSEDGITHSPLYMVLEFAGKGESLNWNPATRKFEHPQKKAYSEEEIRKMMQNATNGLSYCRLNSALDRYHAPRHQASEHFS
jgi:serine/threonine protein kinase